jgi:hypothetical protein
VRSGRRYNMAGVVREQELIAEYRKQALPNYSVFDEKRYFSPGTEPVVFEHRGLRFGLSVCEDIWRHGPTHDAKLAGAQFILNLNASPFHVGKIEERRDQVRARAKGNGVGVLYANMIGGQDELVFDGASFVVDANGGLTHQAAQFEEQMLLVEIESNGSIVPGQQAEPGDDDWQVYNALVTGVRDYVTKNGFQGAVLGLSGGIDSALTLAIAVDALGAENVEVVTMPSRYTADISNTDALAQARSMGVKCSNIPIEPAFNAFLGMLEDEFRGLPADVTEENIQSRCRGIILMAISNKARTDGADYRQQERDVGRLCDTVRRHGRWLCAIEGRATSSGYTGWRAGATATVEVDTAAGHRPAAVGRAEAGPDRTATACPTTMILDPKSCSVTSKRTGVHGRDRGGEGFRRVTWSSGSFAWSTGASTSGARRLRVSRSPGVPMAATAAIRLQWLKICHSPDKRFGQTDMAVAIIV